MKLNDLKNGMVMLLRNGDLVMIYGTVYYVSLDGSSNKSVTNESFRQYYDGDMKSRINKYPSQFDIMRVYNNYTMSKVLYERKDVPVLTEDERVILRNLDIDWICREEDGTLFGCKREQPYRVNREVDWLDGYWSCSDSDYVFRLDLFNHLFNFITWDNAPYSKKELLGEE